MPQPLPNRLTSQSDWYYIINHELATWSVLVDKRPCELIKATSWTIYFTCPDSIPFISEYVGVGPERQQTLNTQSISKVRINSEAMPVRHPLPIEVVAWHQTQIPQHNYGFICLFESHSCQLHSFFFNGPLTFNWLVGDTFGVPGSL